MNIKNEFKLSLSNIELNSQRKRKIKKKKRDKSDLGDNFVAPDGGFGWLVCIGAGLANLCLLPMLQVFGLIFSEKFNELNISVKEIATISNTQIAISSCSGLLNGAIFRKFSFRQVALLGSLLGTIGIFGIAFSNTFLQFIISSSILFGLGIGFCISASSLAVNTYFKENRRSAASYQWTITGLGPIFFPHVVNILLDHYGVQGTVICFSAICFHSFAFSLLYEPVKWHSKVSIQSKIQRTHSIKPCEYCENLKNTTSNSIFASQYLFTEDDEEFPGYSVIGSGVPMCSKSNDGWFGMENSDKRKYSISSKKLTNAETELEYISENINGDTKPNYFRCESETNKQINEKLRYQIGNNNKCICKEKEQLLNKEKERYNTERCNEKKIIEDNELQLNIKWYHKVALFFDLDLLKDLTFINILLGITFSTFFETNLHFFTAFFLKDFGFNSKQIAFIMSVQAIADISVRFLIPICTAKIKWSNRTFLLIGIIGLSTARMFISLVPSFEVTILLSIMVGMFRGFRVIFMGLVLPSYVPLKRLPAATGLQLLATGIVTLLCGPLVGYIKDNSNYTITINFLNIFAWIMIVMWISEMIYKKWIN